MSLNGLHTRTRTTIVAAAITGMTLAGIAPAAAQPQPRPNAMRSFLLEHARPIVQGILDKAPAISPAAATTTADQPTFDWDRIKQEIQERIEQFPPDS